MELEILNTKSQTKIITVQSDYTHSNIHSAINQSKNQIDQVKTQSQPQQYPVIYCSVHQNPAILFCLKPKCQYKCILCTKCVNQQLNHLNKHSPLSVIDQFWTFVLGEKYIKVQKACQKTILDMKIELQDTELEMKNQVSAKVQKIFNKIKKDLEKQKVLLSIQQNNLQRLKFEDKKISNERLTFANIIENLKNITDAEKLDDYLRSVIKQKQLYESASKELKNYRKKCDEYYKSLIEKFVKNSPFINQNTLLQRFYSSFDQIINNLAANTIIQNSIIQNITYIPLIVQRIQDLQNITPQIIRPHTKLIVEYSKLLYFNQQVFQLISKLPVESLYINLKQTKLNQFPFFLPITCKSFVFNFYASTLSISNLQNFEQMFDQFSKIKPVTNKQIYCNQLVLEFGLILGKNNLKCEEMQSIGYILKYLKNLKTLILDLTYNEIGVIGAQFLGESISKLQFLTKLELNLNGFLIQKNEIKDQGFEHIIKNLGKIKNLKQLYLGLGYTNITDISVKLIKKFLKNLPSLNNLQLDLFSNENITINSLISLMKALPEMKLKTLSLNLSHITTLKQQGLNKIIQQISKCKDLEKLELLIKNCGLPIDDTMKLKGKYLHQFEENQKLKVKIQI